MEAVENADYDDHREMNQNPLLWTGLMTHIPRTPQEKHLYKVRRGECGFYIMVQLERKSTVCMNNISLKYMEPVNLVIGACAGTFPAVNSCTLLLKHHRFIEHDSDASYVIKTMPQLTSVYAQLVLGK